MLLDKQNTFSDQQSLAAAAGTVVSTNTIDLQGGTAVFTDTLGNSLLTDLGRSRRIDLLCQVTVAVASGGAATVSFDLCTSTAADQSTGLVVHQSTPAIGYASLVPGYQFRLELPPGLPASGRYLFVRYTVAGATTTAGAFTCGLVADKQTNSYVL